MKRLSGILVAFGSASQRKEMISLMEMFLSLRENETGGEMENQKSNAIFCLVAKCNRSEPCL